MPHRPRVATPAPPLGSQACWPGRGDAGTDPRPAASGTGDGARAANTPRKKSRFFFPPPPASKENFLDAGARGELGSQRGPRAPGGQAGLAAAPGVWRARVCTNQCARSRCALARRAGEGRGGWQGRAGKSASSRPQLTRSCVVVVSKRVRAVDRRFWQACCLAVRVVRPVVSFAGVAAPLWVQQV